MVSTTSWIIQLNLSIILSIIVSGAVSGKFIDRKRVDACTLSEHGSFLNGVKSSWDMEAYRLPTICCNLYIITLFLWRPGLKQGGKAVLWFYDQCLTRIESMARSSDSQNKFFS